MVEAPMTHTLVVRAADHLCALNLSSVIEVMRPLPLKAMPGLPEGACGVALIRGSPTPVVRLAALFDAPPQPVSRFVAIRAGERRVALAVDSVLGIHRLPASPVPLPPLLKDASAKAVEAIRVLDNEFMLVLDTGKLVPDDLWEAFSRREH